MITNRNIAWAMLAVALMAGATEFVFRGVRRAGSDMRDFAVIYASTRAFMSGHNPYEGKALQAAWNEAKGDGAIAVTGPDRLPLYSPTTYLLLTPIALLDWPMAQQAWLAMNLVFAGLMIVLLVWNLGWKLPLIKTGYLTAFILGFGPFHTGISKGQLAVAVTAGVTLAVFLEQRQRLIAAALVVALCVALKPQLGLPIASLYLLQARWKQFAVVAGTVSLMLLGASLRLQQAGVSWIQPMLRTLRVAATAGGVYDPSPANPLSYQLVNATMLFYRILPAQAVANVLVGAMCVVVLYFLWRRGHTCISLLADPLSLASISVLALLIVVHRYYDVVLLVFAFTWALAEVSSWRISPSLVVVFICLLLSIPGPAILVQMGMANAPWYVPQTVWNTLVVPHQVWLLMVMLTTLTHTLRARFRNSRSGIVRNRAATVTI